MDRLEVVDDSAKQKNAKTVVNWNYKLETITVIHGNTGSLEDQSFSLSEGGKIHNSRWVFFSCQAIRASNWKQHFMITIINTKAIQRRKHQSLQQSYPHFILT